MSAPCRSSKARLPADLDPYAPGRAADRKAGLPGASADAPFHFIRRTGRPRTEQAADRRRLPPATLLKTPERSQADGRDRPIFIDRAPEGGRPLLELDLRARLLQCGLDLLGLFLADAFLDRLRRGFDEILGFLEAERGDGAHFLDHFDLLVACRGENDREFGLLLDRRGGRASGGRSGGDRHRGGGRDAPLRFKQFGELRGLQDREAREFVDDFFEIGHCWVSYM